MTCAFEEFLARIIQQLRRETVEVLQLQGFSIESACKRIELRRGASE